MRNFQCFTQVFWGMFWSIIWFFLVCQQRIVIFLLGGVGCTLTRGGLYTCGCAVPGRFGAGLGHSLAGLRMSEEGSPVCYSGDTKNTIAKLIFATDAWDLRG